jgi:hypothetical protein
MKVPHHRSHRIDRFKNIRRFADINVHYPPVGSEAIKDEPNNTGFFGMSER